MTIQIYVTSQTAKKILRSVYNKCTDATYATDYCVSGTVTAELIADGVRLNAPFLSVDTFSGYLPQPIDKYNYELA